MGNNKKSFKVLAEKHGVKEGTLKSRRSREKWKRNKDAIKKKKDETIKKVAIIKESFILDDNLTDKQMLFCIYYIKSFNQPMAAKGEVALVLTPGKSGLFSLDAEGGMYTISNVMDVVNEGDILTVYGDYKGKDNRGFPEKTSSLIEK